MPGHEPLLNSNLPVTPRPEATAASRVLETAGARAAAARPAEAFLGREIGGYRVTEFVGAGGFSMVFRARGS